MLSSAVTDLVTFLGGIGGTVLLLLPGYVLGKVFGRGVRAPDVSDRAFIAASAVGGMICHLLWLGWTIPLARALVRDWQASAGLTVGHYVQTAAWFTVVLLVTPAVLGAVVAWASALSRPERLVWVLEQLGLTSALRTGEAWNWRFRQLALSKQGAWLRIRLKDGAGVFLGKFGPESLASSNPESRDIYLEQSWPVDEQGTPIEGADSIPGVWVAGDRILSIEFLGLGEANGEPDEADV